MLCVLRVQTQTDECSQDSNPEPLSLKTEVLTTQLFCAVQLILLIVCMPHASESALIQGR